MGGGIETVALASSDEEMVTVIAANSGVGLTMSVTTSNLGGD